MDTIFNREYEPPEPGASDLAYKAVQTVVSQVIPGGDHLLEQLVTPPLTRRLNEWREDIAAGLRRLESECNVRLADLSENPKWVDAVLTTTQAAVRTSQARKREALRNAVLNAALPGSLDLTVQQIFLHMTDRFTDHHLVLLELFRAPRKWRTPEGQPLKGGVSRAPLLAEQAFPDFRTREGLYGVLWADLHSASLVDTASLDNGAQGDVLNVKRTTDFGDQYLAFITSPLSD